MNLSFLPAALLLAMPTAAAEPQAAATPATVQADWILGKIARPAPSRTGFVELRGSKLLKQPLRLVGEYRHPDAGTLVREVRSPYAETTTIRAGEAVIERTGKSPRRVSLSRVPELAGIQASFGAMLSGDSERLQRHYTIDADGSRQDWRMTLVPKDARLAERVRNIVLHGRGAELRCIETVPAGDGDGDVQRTLLAGAARDAAAVEDASALAALCDGTATR
ncbi:MAG: fatty acyl CoA synthetase [Pseudomonadota bacterium]|nr:fatty acyl CoA synthetase [Pseudomonadota bacterium]